MASSVVSRLFPPLVFSLLVFQLFATYGTPIVFQRSLVPRFGDDKLELDWAKRFEVCLGVARGLTYLHLETRLRVVHIGDQGFLNSYYAGFADAHLFDPNLPPEEWSASLLYTMLMLMRLDWFDHEKLEYFCNRLKMKLSEMPVNNNSGLSQ